MDGEDKSTRGGLLGNLGCAPELAERLRERVDRIPAAVNEYGFDPWGYNPETLKKFLLPAVYLYHYYFRCVVSGIGNVPRGRVMLIGNHAGQVAFDGLMIMTAMVMHAEPPRLVRGMGEYWLGSLPWVSVLLDRLGSSVGTPQTCVDMLNADECILAFPEGVRGMNKVYADAYQLQDFGLGFMRLALESDTPIVPVAVVGSEEQAPAIANLESVGRIFGMPAFPITLTWPWLGPLGMIPLPARYYIHFGEPMRFSGDVSDDDEVIEAKVDEVKQTLQAMIRQGLAERSSIFF